MHTLITDLHKTSYLKRITDAMVADIDAVASNVELDDARELVDEFQALVSHAIALYPDYGTATDRLLKSATRMEVALSDADFRLNRPRVMQDKFANLFAKWNTTSKR